MTYTLSLIPSQNLNASARDSKSETSLPVDTIRQKTSGLTKTAREILEHMYI